MKLYSNDYLKITVMPLGMTRSTSNVGVRTSSTGNGTERIPQAIDAWSFLT